MRFAPILCVKVHNIKSGKYAKRYEHVIEDNFKFTQSLPRSLTASLRCLLFLVIPLTSALGFRGKGTVDRRKRGHFESAALILCIWSPLMEH